MNGASGTRARVGSSVNSWLADACHEYRGRGPIMIGTDHLLVRGARVVPELRHALTPEARELLRLALVERDRAEAASPTLAERAATADPPGDLEVDGNLRTALWRGLVTDGEAVSPTAPGLPRWHPDVRAAVSRALEDAGAAGVRYIGPADLLGAILAEPDGRAMRLLRRCRVDPEAIVAAHEQARLRPAEEPSAYMMAGLAQFGVVVPVGRSRPNRLFSLLGRRMYRERYVGPIYGALQGQAAQQAVWLGHGAITTAHLVLAVLQLDEQLAATQMRLVDSELAGNHAGAVLARNGITYPDAAAEVARSADPVEATLPPRAERRGKRIQHQYPLWTVAFADACEGAVALATRQEIQVGGGHLLLTALTDLDGAAGRLLRRLGADPAGVADELRTRTAP